MVTMGTVTLSGKFLKAESGNFTYLLMLDPKGYRNDNITHEVE